MKNIILFLYLLVLSIFDCREKKVPAVLLLAGVFAAAAAGICNCFRDQEIVMKQLAGLCIGLLPGGLLLLLAWLTQKIGYGDGIVLLTIGLMMGYRTCFALLCFSMLFAAVLAVLLLLLRKADRQTALPYLPVLTVTFFAGIFL